MAVVPPFFDYAYYIPLSAGLQGEWGNLSMFSFLTAKFLHFLRVFVRIAQFFLKKHPRNTPGVCLFGKKISAWRTGARDEQL